MDNYQFPEKFENRIRRDQADLKSHVERFQVYLRQRDQNGCFSALVDLFIALGTRGLDLRKRLTRQSMVLLTKHEVQFFEDHLESGLTASDSLPFATSSILSESISGTTRIVETDTDPDPDQQ